MVYLVLFFTWCLTLKIVNRLFIILSFLRILKFETKWRRKLLARNWRMITNISKNSTSTLAFEMALTTGSNLLMFLWLDIILTTTKQFKISRFLKMMSGFAHFLNQVSLNTLVSALSVKPKSICYTMIEKIRWKLSWKPQWFSTLN